MGAGKRGRAEFTTLLQGRDVLRLIWAVAPSARRQSRVAQSIQLHLGESMPVGEALWVDAAAEVSKSRSCSVQPG
jgi:hypothetical protein